MTLREELSEILRALGFSPYKATTYITLVELRRATVGEIAKMADVPTSKIYETLRWLEENGYVAKISDAPLTFRANNPRDLLLQDIEKRRTHLDVLGRKLAAIPSDIPLADKKLIQITTTRVAFFKKMKEAVRQSRRSICYLAKHWRFDAELLRLFRQKVSAGVRIRALGPLSHRIKKQVALVRKAGVQVRPFLPATMRFAVYDGSVAVIALKDKGETKYASSVWINSRDLARLLEEHFDRLWENIQNRSAKK